MEKDEVLRTENLTKYYTSGYIFAKKVLGAENVNFSLKRGEIFSLIGESGSGKSTVARMILRLIKPTSGKIYLNGREISSFDKKEYWKKVQGIFQDPYSTFNYFYTVDKPLMDAFDFLEKVSKKKYPKAERLKIINSLIEQLGMNPDEILGRYPHQISGGQMQRLLIIRNMVIDPDVLVADEPTSMTDASTRVAILKGLMELKKLKQTAILFITHDIGQAYFISDRTAVMKDGKIVEMGESEEVFFHPKHPYTKNLVSSVPKLHEKWDLMK